jgi:hypothetical protein
VDVSVLEILSEVAPAGFENDFICDTLELITELSKNGVSRHEIARQLLLELRDDATEHASGEAEQVTMIFGSNAQEQPRAQHVDFVIQVNVLGSSETLNAPHSPTLLVDNFQQHPAPVFALIEARHLAHQMYFGDPFPRRVNTNSLYEFFFSHAAISDRLNFAKPAHAVFVDDQLEPSAKSPSNWSWLAAWWNSISAHDSSRSPWPDVTAFLNRYRGNSPKNETLTTLGYISSSYLQVPSRNEDATPYRNIFRPAVGESVLGTESDNSRATQRIDRLSEMDTDGVTDGAADTSSEQVSCDPFE